MIFKVKISAISVHDAEDEKHATGLALQQLEYELAIRDTHLSQRMSVEVCKLIVTEKEVL